MKFPTDEEIDEMTPEQMLAFLVSANPERRQIHYTKRIVEFVWTLFCIGVGLAFEHIVISPYIPMIRVMLFEFFRSELVHVPN